MQKVEVEVYKLRQIFDAMDTVYPEIEAGVGDGDIKEEVLIELDAAMSILNGIIR